MAGASEILREYLIKLGYQVDSSSSKRFDTAVERSAKLVTEFAAGVEATAAAVVFAFSKMADGMEQLYFVAARSNATVSSIKELQYALSQVGGTAEGAASAVESVGRFLKSTGSGGEGFIKSLGVDTRDANGQLRDTGKIVADLGAAFRKMPDTLAIARANVLGIDYKTLMALRQDTSEFKEEYEGWLKSAGVNTDKVAEATHRYNVELRSLHGVFDILRQKLLLALGPEVTRVVTNFKNFIIAHLGDITKAITYIATGIIGAAEFVSHSIYRLGQAFLELSPKGQLLIEVLGGILVAWKLLHLGFIASPVGLIILGLMAILAIFDDYKTWQEGGKHLIDWDTLIPSLKPYKDEIKAFKDWFEGIWPDMEDPMRGFSENLKLLKKSFLEAFPDTEKVSFLGFLKEFRQDGIAISRALNEIQTASERAGAGIHEAFMGVLKQAGLNASTTLNSIQTETEKTGAAFHRLIMDIVRDDWKSAWDDALTIVQNVFNAIEGSVNILRRLAPALAKTLFGDAIASEDTEAAALREAQGRPGQGAGQRTAQDPGPAAGFESIVDYFRGRGLTTARAVGITTSLERESGLHPQVWGDNGQAYGLAQMHPDRRAAAEQHFHMRMEDMNTRQQLDAIYWDMFEGTRAASGRHLQEGPNEPGAAAATVTREFESPRDGDRLAESDAQRARLRMREILAPSTPVSRLGTGRPVTGPEPQTIPEGYVPTTAGPRQTRIPQINDFANRITPIDRLTVPAPITHQNTNDNSVANSVAVQQTNTFNVSGVTNATSAADEILRGQRRVTGDLARNLPGAVR